MTVKVPHRSSPSGVVFENDWQLRRGTDLPDGNSIIGVSGGSMRVQLAQTGPRTIRLQAAGAVNNEGLEIQKRTADGFTLAVVDDASSALLYTFPGGDTRASDFLFNSTTGFWTQGGNVAIEEKP